MDFLPHETLAEARSRLSRENVTAIVSEASFVVDDHCPICTEKTELLGRGIIAPFISEFSDIPLGQTTEYRWCEPCDFSFFSLRYGPKEMSAIYGAYRSPEYFRIRKSWEPWYTKRINGAYLGDEATIGERRTFMEKTLGSALPNSIESAVDFGGDEGQFFPDIAINKRVVIDLSSRPLREGVTRVASSSELAEGANLVIMAHVLEHLKDPLDALKDVHDHIAEDGLLYVEVPLDRFSTTPGRSLSHDRFDKMLAHRFGFVARDFMTGLCRHFRSTIPRWGVIKQSEHINYFSKQSLERLLELTGFKTISHLEDRHYRVGGARFGRVGIAAKRIPRPPE